MAKHATEFYEHNRCDFENSERYWWVLDATDKCAIVCHGMSKSLLLIVLRREAVVKIFLPPFGCDLVRPPYAVIDSNLFSVTLSFYFREIL